MSSLVAALPMYDWPEVREETDRTWAGLREKLRASGIPAPERLARRNADLPAVPGGIRDAEGRIVAPDPATLPPDAFDLPTLWRHPMLLLAQTCWGPMEQGLAEDVAVEGQGDYSGIEGGEGEFYSSAVLMRAPLPSPLWGGSPVGRGGASAALVPSIPTASLRADPPHKGEVKEARLPLDALRNTRLAYNGTDSMSGFIALSRDLEAQGESLSIFPERIETGAHRASIVAVADGAADVCAVDCRTWHLAKRFEPRAAQLAVVGWTRKRLGLPFITARRTPDAIVQALEEALQAPSSLGSSG